MRLVEGVLLATGGESPQVTEIELTNLPGLLADDHAFARRLKYNCYLERLQTLGIDAYPPEFRKVIYTTNAIESVNMSLRKITKNRGSFPSDEALMKLFYLALRNISQKWTMPIRDWKAALTRFTIQFEDRMNNL
jgi:hypothetical protein